MTEEHVLYCAGIMLFVPKGVWQGSEKNDLLLGFFARGITKHYILLLPRIPKITWRRN